MAAHATGFLNHAAGQPAGAGAEDAAKLSLRGKTVNNGHGELTGIGAVALQVEQLLNSPQERAQKANPKNQAGGRSSFFEKVGDFAQLGLTGFPPGFPLRKVFGVAHQVLDQGWQREEAGVLDIFVIRQREEVSR
ncbi:MAG: hypothetical protein WA741_02530 [Candidatus Sulfotelmatobacter sp.]